MKCPHRLVEQTNSYHIDNSNNTNYKESSTSNTITVQTFSDCLKEECMAYRKVRRVEICQKFPMGYYKDILS